MTTRAEKMMIIISATLNGQWTITVVMVVVDVHKTDTRTEQQQKQSTASK